MNRNFSYLVSLLFSLFIMGCTTDDVDGEFIVVPQDPVEIPDNAFGEYMLFNEVQGVFSEIQNNEVKFFVNPMEARAVSELLLSKTASNTETLVNAGLATAEVKITNLLGLEYFTGLSRIVLTSNEVETIDVTSLAALEALELNFNRIGNLDVSQNTQLKTLRYRASAQASDNQKISNLDLSNNTELRHLFLPNHNLVSIDLSNTLLIDELLDLRGNPGPDGNPDTEDIVIPAAIFDQLNSGNRFGVVSDADVIPEPEDPEDPEDPEPFEIPDAAFAEYMIFNSVAGVYTETIDGEEKFFLNPNEVSAVTVLSLSKTNANVQSLVSAGVSTAEDKITDLTGIEFFTGLQRLVLTSNEVEEMDLAALANLEELEMNFNRVGNLDVSNNIALTRLRYRASAQASDQQKLATINLTNNVNLRHLFLPNHNLVSIDLSNNTLIDDLIDLSGNPGPDGDPSTGDIVIPAAIYNQLAPGNRIGVVPDN